MRDDRSEYDDGSGAGEASLPLLFPRPPGAGGCAPSAGWGRDAWRGGGLGREWRECKIKADPLGVRHVIVCTSFYRETGFEARETDGQKAAETRGFRETPAVALR